MSDKKRDLADGSYDYHEPVLLNKSIENLIWDANGIYIDGTLGGAGHAAEILSKLGNRGILLAFDLDINAIKHSERKLSNYLAKTSLPKVLLFNDRFDKACSKAEELGDISGILLDLGVSSRQLDSDQIGLSYRVNAPLDMRFGEHGRTAEDLLNSADAAELFRVLRDYGEEPFSKAIVRRIEERRRSSSLRTTFDLRMAVEEVVPQKVLFKSLSRVFQAIRIAVNDELQTLENTLICTLEKMRIGGRYSIISYHSLEDRIVKQFFKSHSKSIGNKYSDEYQAAKLKILTQKPIVPDYKEVQKNPRARSAKLRVAEVIS